MIVYGQRTSSPTAPSRGPIDGFPNKVCQLGTCVGKWKMRTDGGSLSDAGARLINAYLESPETFTLDSSPSSGMNLVCTQSLRHSGLIPSMRDPHFRLLGCKVIYNSAVLRRGLGVRGRATLGWCRSPDRHCRRCLVHTDNNKPRHIRHDSQVGDTDRARCPSMD